MLGYGVFYHHVVQAAGEKGWPVERMLEAVRAWGIRYVELDRDDVGARDGDIRRFGRMLEACGLQPSNLCGFYNWQRPGPLPGADDLLLRQAALLGCRRVMLVPGFLEEGTGAELSRMQEATCAMAEAAAGQGMTPTIECFDDSRSPIATMAGMEGFLQAAPALQVTLEAGNFLFSGEDVLLAQERFRGRIRHVHLKDRFLPQLSPEVTPTGEPKTAVTGQVMYPCAVGHGHIPMERLLAGLDREHYSGIMTIEHFGVPSYAKAIEDSITWLKGKVCP